MLCGLPANMSMSKDLYALSMINICQQHLSCVSRSSAPSSLVKHLSASEKSVLLPENADQLVTSCPEIRGAYKGVPRCVLDYLWKATLGNGQSHAGLM